MLIQVEDVSHSPTYRFLLLPTFVPSKHKKRLVLSRREKKIPAEEPLGGTAAVFGIFGVSGLGASAATMTSDMTSLFWYIPGGLLGAAFLFLTPHAYITLRNHLHESMATNYADRSKSVTFELRGGSIRTDSYALQALLDTEIGSDFTTLFKRDRDTLAIGSRKEMKRALKGKRAPVDSELASVVPLIVEYLYKTKPGDIALTRNAEKPDELLAESKQLMDNMAKVYAKRIRRMLDDNRAIIASDANGEIAAANEHLRSYLDLEHIIDDELSA